MTESGARLSQRTLQPRRPRDYNSFGWQAIPCEGGVMHGDEGWIRGRGAAGNPPIRFERLRYEPDQADESVAEHSDPAPATQLYKDSARSIIATNTSPDVGFETSINPYRGCEHGCIY